MLPNNMLASIRPINPAAFGNIVPKQPPQGQPPQQGQMAQGQPPQGQPPQGGDQMTDYLMNKVEEIKKRLGQGDVGALSSVTEAMRSQG